jgi:hypothetical protein
LRLRQIPAITHIMEDQEEWRTIADFPEYSVSSLGRVRRDVARHYFPSGRIMAQTVCSAGGYLKINLSHEGKTRTRLVHRLVCIAFNGVPPTPRHEAAHADGEPTNNRANNLEWKTPRENCADKALHGTNHQPSGEDSPKAMLTDEAVRIIRTTKRYNGVLGDLARRFGVTENTVMGLRTRSCKKWAHVPHHLHPPASSAA